MYLSQAFLSATAGAALKYACSTCLPRSFTAFTAAAKSPSPLTRIAVSMCHHRHILAYQQQGEYQRPSQ